MGKRKDSEQEVLLTPEQYTSRAGFKVIRCRAGQHDWPSSHIIPGTPLPKGIEVWKFPEGYVQQIEECSNGCGKKRDTWLEPGGLMGDALDRGYKDPPGWIRVPRAVGMTKNDWRKAYYSAVSRDLMAVARDIGADE